MGSFFVVTNNDLSDYKKEQSIMLQSTLKDKFLIPDLSSYDDQSNPFQFFSPLTASQRSNWSQSVNVEYLRQNLMI